MRQSTCRGRCSVLRRMCLGYQKEGWRGAPPPRAPNLPLRAPALSVSHHYTPRYAAKKRNRSE
jgi:hypothetical protein